MKAAFREIFWGLLLVNFTLNVNDHNLCTVPGYLLLAVGSRRAGRRSPGFKRASAVCWAALGWVLASVWLFDLFMIGDPITGDGAPLNTAVRTLAEGLLVWTLFREIAEYSIRHGCPELAECALRRRAFGVGLLVPVLLVQIAQPTTSHAPVVALAVILGVVWIAWLVLALGLVHRVRTELAVWDDMVGDDSGRPWQFSLRTLVLAPIVVWLLLAALFPKLVTGDFCNVRIDKLSVEDGKLGFSYSARTSSGTQQDYCQGPGSGGGGLGGGFPAWPGHGGGSMYDSFYGSDGTALTAREISAGLLVERGRTYRVRQGRHQAFLLFHGDAAQSPRSMTTVGIVSHIPYPRRKHWQSQ
jgi:hypothetical protein